MKREGRHFSGVLILLATILIFISGGIVNAQTPETWGNLKPGEYGVGFKAVEKYDYSRVYQNKNDYYGNLIEGERARKMQVYIWYPAQKSDNDVTLVYAEYSYAYPENSDFVNTLVAIHNRQMGQLFGMVGNNRIFVNGFIDYPFAGVKNAEPVEGEFPLLIYVPSLQGSCIENLVMCEYLASHGFIVATTHPVGMKQLNPEISSGDFETLIGDAEFVFGYMNDFPNTNMEKVGTIGFASGGSAALLFQMRNSDIDAVVGLASPYTAPDMIDLVKGNSFYNPGLAYKPVMHFAFENPEQINMTLVDSLFYSSRYLYNYSNTNAMNYFLFETVRKLSGENATSTETLPYEVASDYVLNFYNAILNGDEVSLGFIKNTADKNGYETSAMTVDIKEGMEIPPTSAQFMQIITERGVPEGAALFEKFNALNPGSITFPEANFNMFGYRLINQGQAENAMTIMRMNAEAYPNSTNCWDSYADACLAAGDSATAKTCYETLLKVIDEDENLTDDLRTTLTNNANNFLNPPPATEENSE